MIIDDDLINCLKGSYLIGGNSIYITDLDNVKGFCSSNFEKFDSPINRKLLRIILDMEISECSESFVIINEKSKIIPIFEDSSLNIDWSSQIILPIWFDDHIQGSLVFTNFHKTLHEKHLEFVKTTQKFIEGILIQQINKNYLKEEHFNEE